LPLPPAAPTLHHVIDAAAKRLAAAGVPLEDAAFDAEVLARHVLGWDRATYLLNRHNPEPAGFAAEFARVVARREGREPVHLIVGSREFWGREFEISRAVLSPRPETELIVETGLDLLDSVPGPPLIADVGTGSGCLAITLAIEVPRARVVATDFSPEALALARRNARRHGAHTRISFVRSDYMRGLRGPFDLIVSNPPYVPDEARDGLDPEVREYEPGLALFSGPGGYDGIRALVEQAPACLGRPGWLVMEFGAGQVDEVTRVVAAARKLTLIEVRRDLQGLPRVAVIRQG
jgi:release factor glutamine methyltransferase